MAIKLHCGHWGEICEACKLVSCFICDREHNCVVKTDRIIWVSLAVIAASAAWLLWLY